VLVTSAARVAWRHRARRRLLALIIAVGAPVAAVAAVAAMPVLFTGAPIRLEMSGITMKCAATAATGQACRRRSDYPQKRRLNFRIFPRCDAGPPKARPEDGRRVDRLRPDNPSRSRGGRSGSPTGGASDDFGFALAGTVGLGDRPELERDRNT
jgi:hypothetical protein